MVTQPKGQDQPETAAGHGMANTVREAWLATASLGDEVDHETRKSAFMLVLEAMLKGAGPETAQPTEPSYGTGTTGSDTSIVDELYSTPDLRMDAIAGYLEIEGSQVWELYDLVPREPELRLQPSQLSRSTGAATRELALLVLGARTALGLDTELDQLRPVVQGYRKYDAEAFLKTLQTSPEFVLVGRRRLSRPVVRLRAAGVQPARQLAKRLVAA